MITKQEQSAIEKIVRDPKWSFIQKVADELIVQIGKQPANHESEWSFIADSIIKEGQIKGIVRLFQKLNEIINAK